ncbi:MAG: 2-methylcitrate dehydratase [Syntrophorhabdus sp. PtaU1.Bin058]|nr:MAG: 2-methylcitrate dehydratase [Syntrophorhabdus sp. PtaU1.Bin058]
MTTTKKLADLVIDITYKDFPKEAVRKGKECILDTLGCILAGCKSAEGTIMLEYAEEIGGKEEASIIGFGRKTNSHIAALVNGTLGHSLDFDDAQDSLMGHPSTVILPAVLALGEKLKSSGESILEAFIVGFEVACKIGKAVNPELYKNGWHSTNAVGVLGATAATAKLSGFESTRVAVALGIAASLSGGLRANFGTMTKPFHAGKAAENAVVATRLAASDFTASDQILEAKNGFCATFSGKYDLSKVVNGFADPLEIISPGVRLKPYPSCLETHSVIEATLSIVEKYDIQPDNVESVECRIAPLALNILIHQNPQNHLQGKFSAQYAVATALIYRKASLHQFTDGAVRNPDVQSIIKKTSVFADPEMEQAMQSAVVTIKLLDGREYTKRVDITTGHPQKPMFLDNIIDKYKNCAALTINEDNIERSINEVLDFETIRNLDRLMSLIGGR